jgi:hypothetical protein
MDVRGGKLIDKKTEMSYRGTIASVVSKLRAPADICKLRLTEIGRTAEGNETLCLAAIEFFGWLRE